MFMYLAYTIKQQSVFNRFDTTIIRTVNNKIAHGEKAKSSELMPVKVNTNSLTLVSVSVLTNKFIQHINSDNE